MIVCNSVVSTIIVCCFFSFTSCVIHNTLQCALRLDVFGSEATPLTILGEDDDTAVYEGTEGIGMNAQSVSSQARGESRGTIIG